MLQFAAAAVTMSYSYSKHNHVTVSKLQASSLSYNICLSINQSISHSLAIITRVKKTHRIQSVQRAGTTGRNCTYS